MWACGVCRRVCMTPCAGQAPSVRNSCVGHGSPPYPLCRPAPPSHPCTCHPQVPTIEPRPRGAFGQRFPQNAPSLPSSSSSALPAAAAGGGRGSAQKLPPLAPRVDSERLGPDGLPHVGAVVWPGQALYTTRDLVTGKYKAHKLKGEEVAHIEQVRARVWAVSSRWRRAWGSHCAASAGTQCSCFLATTYLVCSPGAAIGWTYASMLQPHRHWMPHTHHAPLGLVKTCLDTAAAAAAAAAVVRCR
jgi:hypothetical protein